MLVIQGELAVGERKLLRINCAKVGVATAGRAVRYKKPRIIRRGGREKLVMYA